MVEVVLPLTGPPTLSGANTSFRRKNSPRMSADSAVPETSSTAAAEVPSPALPYVAPVIAPPTPDEIKVTEGRKRILRALDSKITQQDDRTALAALELALKLVTNILEDPDNPKKRRFKASNPTISQKLIKVPGGVDLLLAAGFTTTVIEMQEHWQLQGSGVELVILDHARDGLARYKASLEAKVQAAARARDERMRGLDKEKEQILQQIEGDKADRKDKSWR